MTTLGEVLGLPPGASPFPWQSRLFEDHISKGEIPSALDIPTGLGKTAVIGIWLLARARGAAVPRRLVYVVDRRAVVDQATREAERLRAFVDATPAVKAGLGLARSLPISTLRGQHVDNREWLEDPSLPAIIVGTVDMIGSRLLFEGYRCSRKMRPYHAGLLGVDSLVVLDEAHLVPPFQRLVESIAKEDAFRPRSAADRGVVTPLRAMSLSATGRSTADAFELSSTDLEHDIVRRRLDAAKHLEIREAVAEGGLCDTLADAAWDVTRQGTAAVRCIVFVHSRDDAQAVRDAIAARAGGDADADRPATDIEEPQLFVGGRRVHERVEAAEWLDTHGFLAGNRDKPSKACFVIATSAGEVGVDLDADHAVLDLVEWERMVQRLGRVNRRGDGQARVVVIPSITDDKTLAALAKEAKLGAARGAQHDDFEDDDVDGDGAASSSAGGVDADEDDGGKKDKQLKPEERLRVDRYARLEATEDALRSLRQHGSNLDASPGALVALKRDNPELVARGSTPPPLHPALTRPLIEAWSMTSIQEHTGRPEVAPWLRGWDDGDDPQTAVVWRTHLPRPTEAADFFEAAPPHTAEVVEVETWRVLDWLLKRVKVCAKRIALPAPARGTIGEADPTVDVAVPELSMDAVVAMLADAPEVAYTLQALASLDKRGKDTLLRRMYVETLVVDARLGGLQHGLLDSRSDHASDVSDLGVLPFRVVVTSDAQRAAPHGWREELRIVRRSDADGRAIEWLVVDSDEREQSTTAEGRSTGRAQTLDDHESCAERHARRIAEAAGLPEAYTSVLALAARLHDEGKRAARWQRAFRAEREGPGGPWGKTTSRPNLEVLDGYRHELGSLQYAERDPRVAELGPDLRDLLLHVIAAHHGHARPIISTRSCDEAPPSALVTRAREIALRFARLEKKWGPWGLAWWEALLRAADQGASRENDEAGARHG